jgi:hypothetical protein
MKPGYLGKMEIWLMARKDKASAQTRERASPIFSYFAEFLRAARRSNPLTFSRSALP